MRKLTLASLVALVVGLTIGPWPAFAAPQSTRIVSVFQEPCDGSGCDGDSPLESGSLADGEIRIRSASSSTIGLEWLRLEGRLAGADAWTCLQSWNGGGATSMQRDFVWNTKRWPESSACPSADRGDGSRTSNGAYELRVRAREVTTGSQQTSATFSVKVANRPSVPTWASDPRPLRDGNGNPLVELKWYASPEPDVIEYRFVRESANGGRVYAVDADAPGKNGCARSSTIFTCYDDDFASSGYGGEYTYTVVAYRATPDPDASTCTYGGRCLASQATPQQSASLDEPSPSPSPTTKGSPSTQPSTGGSTGSSTSGSPTASPRRSPSRVLGGSTDYREFYTGEFDESLPYEERGGFSALPGDVAGGGSSSDADAGFDGDDEYAFGEGGFDPEPMDRRVVVSLATGLLMVLTAMHVVRLLFDR